jgi:beta-glucuronidase
MIYAVVMLAASSGAPAQETGAGAIAADTPTFLVAGDLRPGTDLSGTWHYSIDPYRSGVAGFHGEALGPSEARWIDADVGKKMRKQPRSLFDFDMDRSPTATLPGSWLIHSAEMRHYQ